MPSFGRWTENDDLDRFLNKMAAEVERLGNLTVTAPLDLSSGPEGLNIRMAGGMGANIYVEAITAVRRDQIDCRGYLIDIDIDSGELTVTDEEVEFMDIGVFPTFIEIPTGSEFRTFLKNIGGVYVIDPPHWIHAVSGQVSSDIAPQAFGGFVSALGTIDEAWNWAGETTAVGGSQAMAYWGTYPGASFPEPHWHIIWECSEFSASASGSS